MVKLVTRIRDIAKCAWRRAKQALRRFDDQPATDADRELRAAREGQRAAAARLYHATESLLQVNTTLAGVNAGLRLKIARCPLSTDCPFAGERY